MRRLAPLALLVVSAIGSGLADPSGNALEQANTLIQAARYPEARAQLSSLVANEPRNASALRLLGQTELKLHNRESAVDAFARAAALSPEDAPLLADYGTACLLVATDRGVSFSAIGFARRGRDALEKAAQLAPDSVAYREGLVQFYARAPAVAGGSFAKAYAHLAEIARRDPARAEILKANVLCSEQRYEESAAACEAFLRDHPDSYLAHYTLGRVASETGRNLPQGEQHLRRCLQLTPLPQEPDHAGAYYRIGVIAEKAGRLDDARQAYEFALREEPSQEKAASALARLRK